MTNSTTVPDSTNEAAEGLGHAPVAFDHLQMCVGNVVQSAYYFCKGFGFTPVPSAEGREAGAHDRSSTVLAHSGVRLKLTGSIDFREPVAHYVQRHGDSVRDIALVVGNVEEAYSAALRLGARPVEDPHRREWDGGATTLATVGVYGDVVHTFVQREGDTGPHDQAGTGRAPDAPVDFVAIDHLAIVLERGTLDRWADFYTHALGFRETYRQEVSTGTSGMRSKVFTSPNGVVTLTFVEPGRGWSRSQIDEYLAYHKGPGVQHIALRCEDIFATLRHLRQMQIRTLEPLDGYYDELWGRLGPDLADDFATTRDLGVFADRDEDGVLLQSFTAPIGNRPTAFFEIIERRGARRFGAANVKALFAAMEREQAERGHMEADEPLSPPSAPRVRVAGWAENLEASYLQTLLPATQEESALSFSLGLPDPRLFPTQLFARSCRRTLVRGGAAFQYGPPLSTLKAHIVEIMRRRGVQCSTEQVFLTTGAQQAVSLVTKLLAEPDDQVIMEEFIYSGFLQAVQPAQARPLTTPTDLATGMDVDAVSRLLDGGCRPAFLYAIPDGHNPLGVSLSQPKRARLVELAREHAFPIVEDDTYGLLGYDRLPAALRSLDDEWVFYIGSFSKVLGPALRVGWLVLPERFIPALSVIKEGSDLNIATFAQRVLCEYLDSGDLERHLAHIRDEYRQRRDCMLQCVAREFPPGTRSSYPNAGFFVWAELPGLVDTRLLLDRSMAEQKIAFVPGAAFAQSRDAARQSLRLSFSMTSVDQIRDGISRLGDLLKKQAGSPAMAAAIC